MKLRILLLLFIAAIGFNSCNTDNTLGPGNNGTTGTVVVASINGVAWGAETGYVRTGPNFSIELHGVHGSTSRIMLAISPYNGLQTYQVNGITKVTFHDAGMDYTSTTGQITVSTDNDQFVEGFFSCELISTNGSQSLSITNGQFIVPRQ